jgi:hypothetical protein
MNADHEEAVEFAKTSKRENRVYVGNLSYDVKYRDLMEFMRGGGWGNLRLVFRSLWCGRGEGAPALFHQRTRLGRDVAFLSSSAFSFALALEGEQ